MGKRIDKYQAQIPQTPKVNRKKRCYSVWQQRHGLRWGGKIVWLTDKELMFATLKYPDKLFYEVLERDMLEEYKKYINATIE